MIQITVHQIITLHRKSIERYGGDDAVLDIRKVESALNFLHLEEFSIPEITGILAFRLVKNHPFADGNKRTALLTALLFLKINNYKYTGRSQDIEYLIMDLSGSKKTKEDAMSHFFHFSEKL